MTQEKRFQELYRKFHQLVLKAAYNRVQDYYEAQDICQETFVKMYDRLDLFLADDDIKCWLLVVADHAATDRVRKWEKQMVMEELSEEEIFQKALKKAAEDDCLDEVMKKELCTRILDHLRQVNEEQFEIVNSVCCMQMSVGETAARLGLTYQQASMKLHRARTWIRVNYGEEYENLKY